MIFQKTRRFLTHWFWRGAVFIFFLHPSAYAQSNLGTLPANSALSPQPSGRGPYNPLEGCAPPKNMEIYTQRLQEYQDALRENPRDAELYYHLGVVQARLQKWDESQKSFFQTLTYSQDPQLVPQVYHQLGNLYACQKKFDNAIAQYKQTLRRTPQDEDTKHNLALTQLLAHQEKQQGAANPQQPADDNREKADPQQNKNPAEKQQGSDEDTPQKENPEHPGTSEQELEGGSQQDPSTKQANPLGEEDSSDGQSAASAQSGSAENDQNAMQAALSRKQAHQLINTTPENRRKFIQRLIQRENLPAHSSGKQW